MNGRRVTLAAIALCAVACGKTETKTVKTGLVCGAGTVASGNTCVPENPLVCGPGTTESGGTCVPLPAPTTAATLHLGPASGGVAVTPSGYGASVVATAAHDAGLSTLDVTVRILNESARILFNPKLVVSASGGATVVGDGTLGGKPYFYFGPEGVEPGDYSRAVTMHFTGVTADFDLQLQLQTDPLVLLWGGENGPWAIDSGTQEVEGLLLASNKVRFTAISPQGRYAVGARSDVDGIEILDLVSGEVDTVSLTPAGNGTEAGTVIAGLAFSADGAWLWVVADTAQVDTTRRAFLAKLETSEFTEVGRVTFADLPVSGSCTQRTACSPGRNLRLDEAHGRAWLPMFTLGVRVVDLDAMAEIDTDGNAGNGITPIVLPGTTYPTSAALSGGKLYVGRGSKASSGDVVVIDTTTFAVEAPLSSATTGLLGSGANLQIGPDGRLWVPRTGYPSQAGDPDSFGISAFDLSAGAPVEARVSVLGSFDATTPNDDIWDIAFVPGRDLAYASMIDRGWLFPFDWRTRQAIDADGDPANGHTNVDPGGGQAYGGGSVLVTPF